MYKIVYAMKNMRIISLSKITDSKVTIFYPKDIFLFVF